MRILHREVSRREFPRRIVVLSTTATLIVLVVGGLANAPRLGPIAWAAPVPVPTHSIMLFIRGAFITYYRNSGYFYPRKSDHMCIGMAAVGGYPYYSLSDGIVRAPLGWLGLDIYRRTADGKMVLWNDTGHTVIIADLSPEVIVDGRRVILEDVVRFVGPSGVRSGPLNTLAPLVGYELKFGTLPSPPGAPFSFWILVYRTGEQVPEPVLRVRRVLADRTSWLLLLDSYGWIMHEGCGRLARVSGALVPSPEGPWARARDLGELGWKLRWNAGRRIGVVSAGPVDANFRLEGNRVTVKGKRYRIPPALAGAVRNGEVVLPIGPTARALGIPYWQSGPVLRVFGLCGPQC